jgi:hypothetical protein
MLWSDLTQSLNKQHIPPFRNLQISPENVQILNKKIWKTNLNSGAAVIIRRLSAGEKKADEEEKKRKHNEFGAKPLTDYENNNTGGDYFRHRSRTPSMGGGGNMMSRSVHEYYRNGSLHTYVFAWQVV